MDTADQHNSFIRISDPDTPIYRFYPLWFFESALSLKQLVLIPPQKWEDPFELLPSRTMLTNKRNLRLQFALEQFLWPVFAQCWSMNQESDTLWRAYSRVELDQHSGRNIWERNEAVRVRSTPRRLLAALVKSPPAGTLPGSCFIGGVRYQPAQNIQQELVNFAQTMGFNKRIDSLTCAHMYLRKRPIFRHEEEVRLIYVDQREVEPQELTRIQIDPMEVFDEVTFDPRLGTFEHDARERRVKELHYEGTVTRLDHYQGMIIDGLIDREDWPTAGID